MKKEDVLLTPEEIDYAHNGKEAADSYEWDCDINKAQCLKLLYFMKKNYQCPEDMIVHPGLLIMSKQQVDELEKLLKER